MKAYTDIEQSKKLAEFLPLESADMYYPYFGNNKWGETARFGEALEYSKKKDILCWSLEALLDLIPYNVTFNRAVYRFKLVKFSDHWECYHENFGSVSTKIFKANNQIDACYEMIIELHEQKVI